LNEIDQLEQEIITLRQRFAQSAEILDDLSHIKGKFDQLSDHYQMLQGNLEQAKVLLDTSPSAESVEPRLAQVEAQMDVRYEQLQAQLTNLRFDFEASIRQLREETHRSPQKPSQANASGESILGGVDEDNRIKWMESSLQHLNTTVYSDRSMLQKLDRRVSNLKRTVDIVAVAGFGGLMFLLLLVFIFR
jgi:chromosome segregation ATPase